MNPFVSTFLGLVPVYGPWLIFSLAALETCFVTGIVVPSGMVTSLGAVLVFDGTMELRSVAVAAVAGGALGDSLGFWVGRLAGDRLLTGEGRIAALARRRPRLRRLVGRHPAYSVTAARCLAFVRTFMPMAAGMSSLRYRRFLPYDLLGVVLWAGIYLGIGALAGESWRRVVHVLDVGGAISLVLVALGVWALIRRAVRSGGAGRRGENPPC